MRLGRFVARHKFRAFVIEQRHDRLVAVLPTFEVWHTVEGAEIQLVEKRSVALGRSAIAIEINRPIMYPHRALTVEQLPHQRIARMLVALGGGVVPQEAVRNVRVIRIHQPRAMPVAAAFVFAHQRHVAGFTPVNF